MNAEASIQSRDYWFKVIEMLQQNWTLAEPTALGVTVYSVNDASGVFDELRFESSASAEIGLQLNGFRPFVDDEHARPFLHCPEPPFTRHPHRNGPIYSSGRFWASARNTNTTI